MARVTFTNYDFTISSSSDLSIDFTNYVIVPNKVWIGGGDWIDFDSLQNYKRKQPREQKIAKEHEELFI